MNRIDLSFISKARRELVACVALLLMLHDSSQRLVAFVCLRIFGGQFWFGRINTSVADLLVYYIKKTAYSEY